MKTRTIVLASLVALLALAACDTADTVDTGCTAQYFGMGIRVVDEGGQGVADATVSATNLGTGRTLEATTAPNGWATSIGESIGAGTVRIVARLGDASSAPIDTHWDTQGCHVVPREAELVLVMEP